MFGQKRNTINDMKRKWMAILFLVLFVTGGISLTGMLQTNINTIKNSPVSVQSETDDDYEEETIEFKEMIEISKLPALKLAMVY